MADENRVRPIERSYSCEHGLLPRTTVLMPVFNAQAYLHESIESVLAQTIDDWELLIIDDGSTDGSLSIAQSFVDPRIRILCNEHNMGLIATLNRGIDETQTGYIARLDADDVSMPRRLQHQLQYLREHASCSAVFSDYETVDHAGRHMETVRVVNETLRQDMARRNEVAHSSVMIRSAVARQYRYRAMQRNAEDYDLWLRLLSDGYELHSLPEPLVKIRVHPQSITAQYYAGARVHAMRWRAKLFFLCERLGRLRWRNFEWLVLRSMLTDAHLYCRTMIWTALHRHR